MVERLLAKEKVAGSTPVCRSKNIQPRLGFFVASTYTLLMFQRLPLIIGLIFLPLIALWAGFSVSPNIVTEPSQSSALTANPTIALSATPSSNSVKITFVGDIMLAREVEKAIIANGVDYPFAAIKNVWQDSDLVIGNFEDTVRPVYRDEGSVLAFDTQPEHITGLKNAGFTDLSMANNHENDWGPQVTKDTRAVLEALGLTTFGDPVESQLHIAHVTKNGITFSLIGFHAFIEDTTVIATAIKAEKAAGNFVIVMPHWGNEYQLTASPAQIDAATMFVNAGADLIVGAHPHVIKPISTIANTPVAYSLGNFIFDQDWSVATTQGLMLQITIDDKNITIQPVAINIQNRQASLGTFPVQAAQTWERK